ncbi:STAS domain-containing protein [uncultured Pseudokineococcus sp.]|uniref:STAS domain-containing protein n=1 Tax=uncultured Pseudokineococcus sp. TaxID=1642928 RepID=UPI00262C719E|nr:STAS domain-containing protein [uncultured Pseudokineococcus sp.]
MLALSGRITHQVLDRCGYPTGAVLARVHTVEASAVEGLDQAGAGLLVRVHLAARGRGTSVHLPSPSRAVVEALARYGRLSFFDPAPHGQDRALLP